MAKKKQLTEAQKDYNKQLRRIKQFVRRAEKRGYVFSENIIPKKPKRVTKASVKKLQKITPKELYKKAQYAGSATHGEIVSGEEGRKAERKASAEKAAKTKKKKKSTQFPKQTEQKVNVSRETLTTDINLFTNIVIKNFRNHLKNLNEVVYIKLTNWLNNLLSRYGADDVAIMLNEGAENGVIANYQIVYSNDKIINYISEMLDYLPEIGEFSKAEIMDAFEQDEDYEELL